MKVFSAREGVERSFTGRFVKFRRKKSVRYSSLNLAKVTWGDFKQVHNYVRSNKMSECIETVNQVKSDYIFNANRLI